MNPSMKHWKKMVLNNETNREKTRKNPPYIDKRKVIHEVDYTA
jgi:hypothetical protein